ncbi:unnamed protein product, partial [Didymodactylos carnosus]
MSRAIDRMERDYWKAKKMVSDQVSSISDKESVGDTGTSSTAAQFIVKREPDLSQDEKKYLAATDRGDMANVRKYLESSVSSESDVQINVNCIDPFGRSALLIAIENENLEMIQLLLSYNVDTGEALLHAIDEGFVEAINLLLQHDDQKRIAEDKLLYDQCLDKQHPLFGLAQDALEKQRDDVTQKVTEQLNLSTSRSYTPDITPIILAAHRDNYEIIQILFNRGDLVSKPHDVRCNCEKCLIYNKEDSLRHSRSRINAYKALSSPFYISISSDDPIQEAFKLNRELKRLSRIENEFKEEYEKLAQQCQEYSAALLAETRSSKELEIILNFDNDNPPGLSENEKMNLSRLKMAIRYKQKKFVSHSHCQQLLASLWYEGLPGFRRRHAVIKILITGLVGLLFPLLAIAYLLMPRSLLLFIISLRIDFGKWSDKEEDMNERRGPPPNPVELAIMVYVAGFIWAEIKQLYQEGLHQYMADTWNLLDWITNCLYVATIILRVMAYIKVNKEERDRLVKMAKANITATISHIDRKDWDPWDPTLISEGVFAAANIFSSLKLVYIFTINPHLGPLQISLGRMVHDILKFSVLIMLVAFAFACGLNQLFWYYARMKKRECAAQLAQSASDEYCAKDIYKHFSNLFEALQTLFWGTFGLIDLQTFQIHKRHTFTMFIGLLMYGVYSSIMIIVLLNMLIAMMSNSYQYIANQTETEWKFARAKLWTSYFEDGGTLPPPFNIIPSPKSIYYVIRYLYWRVCGCSRREWKNRWQSLNKIMTKMNERRTKYRCVIRELIKRYTIKRQQKHHTGGVTEDDLDEIRKDISAFRFELLEILTMNGYNIQMSKKNPGKAVKRIYSTGKIDCVLQRLE